MKKFNIGVAVALLAGSVMCSSCIGSYRLFNKYEKWQCNMTNNKYVNGIVGLLIEWIVAPVCLLVDTVVLNTIEFWSGTNPMSAGTTTTVKGQDGRLYTVKVLKDGYEVKAPTGEITLFIHDDANDSWSMEQNGVTKEIFRFNTDGTIQASLKNGEKLVVTNDEAGLNKVRESILSDQNYFAQR